MKGFILLMQCSIQITLRSFTLDCPIHNSSFLCILPTVSQLNVTNHKHVLKLQKNIGCCVKSGKTNPKYLQLSVFAWSHQLHTTADPPHWGGFQVKRHIETITDKGYSSIIHILSSENSDANTDDKMQILQNVGKGPYMKIFGRFCIYSKQLQKRFS